MASPAATPKPAERSAGLSRPDILPTLFGAGYGTYQVQPKNYVLSFVLHIAAIAVILVVTTLIARNQPAVTKYVSGIITLSEYVLPAAPDAVGGGGGGGTREKLTASRGAPPKPADEQFTPPTVVVPQQPPKIVIEPTVIVPPQIQLSDATLGDALAKIQVPPSNGVGSNAGIGEGTGTGLGAGRGPGVGQGWGGGIGGGPYRVGGGVSAPRAVYAPDPEYSEEARKAKYQGTVVLWIVVGPDGRVHDMRVSRALGLGLDEKALEAVKQWRFEPARKDGQAVAVQVNIEVNFRLY
jgi:periplasmic protein TonB